jgi:hypothetical protein
MDHDFLDGIDEQFQRLMKLYGNGKGNGRPESMPKEDRLTIKIVEQLDGLSAAQKEEVLSYIQTFKEKLNNG